ncbi:stressosome-associated protein Prli42 [Corticicoccus populi]|uniref:Stressosome-associated protein Prli42 n=1 Tax=Corticicoccus populi TaxID=1812821 RepID=A0ABW5WVI5_9STAP
MQNKKIQKYVIWFMVFLIVVSGLLMGLGMLTQL